MSDTSKYRQPIDGSTTSTLAPAARAAATWLSIAGIVLAVIGVIVMFTVTIAAGVSVLQLAAFPLVGWAIVAGLGKRDA